MKLANVENIIKIWSYELQAAWLTILQVNFNRVKSFIYATKYFECGLYISRVIKM